MTLQNLPFSFQPPPLPSDLGPGTLVPPAAAQQPLRTARREAFSLPCQESWFLFKLHKGSCFNQKVYLRNFVSLFHDCGWEKLGARVVFCCWSAAAFPRERNHIFLLAEVAEGGCLPSARRQPSCFPTSPRLSKLPEVTGTTSWDGLRRARELLTARGRAMVMDAMLCLAVGFWKASAVLSIFSSVLLRRRLSPESQGGSESHRMVWLGRHLKGHLV